MLLKFIIFIILIYWIGKLVFQFFFSSPDKASDVKGNSGTEKPLDLTNYDVEDVDYEDIDE